MRNREQAFTLIELIMTIVIVGVLGAMAVSRFYNLSDDSHTAAAQGTFAAYRQGILNARAAWLAGGGVGTTVALGGTVLNVNAQGYPTASSVNDCVDLWNGVMDTSIPLTSFSVPGNDGWAAFFFAGGSCVYFLREDNTPLRLFSYNPGNGQFSAANL